MKIIARIKTDFPTKFGIPRQSGLVDTEALIVFEEEYRVDEALRGIEEFSHLWLIWEFSEAKRDTWSPTVRPPRLGGNKRVGVFATRSPFRPNPIGLSCVKLKEVRKTTEGSVLVVTGADLMDGTPIYDIKPYLPLSDMKPQSRGSFSDEKASYTLDVEIPENLLNDFPKEKTEALRQILAQDPRPQYIDDETRVFGFLFGGSEIKFKVEKNTLTVVEITKLN